MTFFGRQRSEPLSGVADSFTLLRRQITKSLEPLAQLLLLVLGHLLPLLKPLLGLVAFLRLHVGPLARPIAQPFLPFRRQLVPIPVERLEQLLFVFTQLLPRHSRWIPLRPRGSSKPEHQHQADHDDHHGFTSFWGTVTSVLFVPFRLDSRVCSDGCFCL